MPRIVWSGPWEQRPERIFLGSRSMRKRRRSKNEDESGRPRAYLGGSKSMSLQVAEEWAGSAAGVLDAMTAGTARTGVLAQRSLSPALSTAASMKNTSTIPSPWTPLSQLPAHKLPALQFTALGLPVPQQPFLPTPGEGTPNAGSNPRHPVSFLPKRAHRPPVSDELIPPYTIFSSRSFRGC